MPANIVIHNEADEKYAESKSVKIYQHFECDKSENFTKMSYISMNEFPLAIQTSALICKHANHIEIKSIK